MCKCEKSHSDFLRQPFCAVMRHELIYEAMFIGCNGALAVNFTPLFIGISTLAQAAAIPPQSAQNCRANSPLHPMNTASNTNL